MASVYTNTEQNGSVQLATMKDVNNVSNGNGLGGKLIGTYKFTAGRSSNPSSITLTTPADYLVVNVITGNVMYLYRARAFSPGGSYTSIQSSSGNISTSNSTVSAYSSNSSTSSVIVYKGGDAYIPSTIGYSSDSDAECWYCGGAMVSASISLSADGLTITNTSNSSYSPAYGTIEVYALS